MIRRLLDLTFQSAAAVSDITRKKAPIVSSLPHHKCVYLTISQHSLAKLTNLRSIISRQHPSQKAVGDMVARKSAQCMNLLAPESVNTRWMVC